MSKDDTEAVKELIQTTGAGVGITVNDDTAEHLARMQQREELRPELKLWVEDGSVLGPFLKHPLVYMGLADPGEDGIYPFAAQANHAYEQKQAMLEKAMGERNWFVVVFVIYERPYRLYAFQKIIEDEELSDEEYWNLLGSIWTDSENIYQNQDEWMEHLHADRPGAEAMMEDEERAALEKLPDHLAVYRGFCVDGREEGFSWTISRERAEWFAKRLCQPDRGDEPRVISGVCKKEDALAYFTGRGEDEILILPENVSETKVAYL